MGKNCGKPKTPEGCLLIWQNRPPCVRRPLLVIVNANTIHMPLSRKAIEKLKTIYKDAYGKELSDDDAWEMGHRLLRVFYVLTRPVDEENNGSKSSNGLAFD